ncbi:hypothetical protein EDC04DRAFT_2904724 [Pisolithus marmoratus]|nr:hypothetical protein EDC04DRAFT_2904724 [Pisolithus marmoratus]
MAGVIAVAEALITRTVQNPAIHEREFCMLWNGILGFHFPMAYAYLVGPKRASCLRSASMVRVTNLSAKIMLAVELKKPAEDTAAGRQRVVEELVTYSQQHLDETWYSIVYAIGVFGLSFAIHKVSKSRPLKPRLVFDWTSNVTAPASFDTMVQLAYMIDGMTGTTRDEPHYLIVILFCYVNLLVGKRKRYAFVQVYTTVD